MEFNIYSYTGTAFNKTDKAMYLAKEQGKNKVVFCSKLERSLEMH
jgi:PleD family two-component response regulator